MRTTSWAIAVRGLRRAKGRSVLMGLGLVIGVLSISLTVATGEGARRAVARSFKSMIGSLDVLLVQPGGEAQRGMATMASAVTTLSIADADAIRESVPNVRAVGIQQSAAGTPIEAGDTRETTFLFGASANWGALRGDSVAAGAYFTDADNAALARVAVLGPDVARELFPSGNAVGQRVRIRGIEFTVIGVLAHNGAGPGGFSMDDLVYIPFETGRRRVFDRDNLSLAMVKLDDASQWAGTQAAITTLLRRRHGIVDGALADFRVSSPQAMITRVANVDSALRRGLLWVGALALVIGGMVIANLMFAATVARRREIAMRRAVGATRRDVLGQFWAEAVLVAAGSALAGAVLGIAITMLGSRMMRMPLAVSWPVTFGVMCAALAIGAASGYLPARRAAVMLPSEVLRDAE